MKRGDKLCPYMKGISGYSGHENYVELVIVKNWEKFHRKYKSTIFNYRLTVSVQYTAEGSVFFDLGYSLSLCDRVEHRTV